MTSELLTTQDVAESTGWSIDKVRMLIKSKRLLAVNTSSGSRPTYAVRREALLDFLVSQKGSARKIKNTDNVPEVF
jgi:hypothetical protein